MLTRFQKQCLVVIPLAVSMFGCARPVDDTDSNNRNAAQENAAPQDPVPRNGTPMPDSGTGQPGREQPPNPSALQPAILPAASDPAGAKAGEDTGGSKPSRQAGGAGAPVLILATKKIDFGIRPKDKTFTRSIAVRNGGTADLEIRAVEPS